MALATGNQECMLILAVKPAAIIKRHNIFRNLHSFSMNRCVFESALTLHSTRSNFSSMFYIYLFFFSSCVSLSLFLCYFFFLHQFCFVLYCCFDIPHWSFSSYVLLTWHKFHWMHTGATWSRIDWEARKRNTHRTRQSNARIWALYVVILIGVRTYS